MDKLERLYPYKSLLELRQAYALRQLRKLGVKEGSEGHQVICDDYNLLVKTPLGLPRGHKAVLSDDWCAIFVAGQAHAMGLTDCYPMECSCSKIIEIAEARGTWIENDNYRPMVADWVLYAWEAPDGENMEKPDHIGTVYGCDGENIYVVEGNKGDKVDIRVLKVGDARIRGFVVPNLAFIVGWLVPDEEAVEAPTEAVVGMAVYDTVEEVPEAYRPIIDALIEDNALRGYGSADKLGLSEDLCRALVVQERRYQALLEKLAAAGLLSVK